MKIEKKSTFNNKLIEIKLNAPNLKFFAKKQANSFGRICRFGISCITQTNTKN